MADEGLDRVFDHSGRGGRNVPELERVVSGGGNQSGRVDELDVADGLCVSD